MPRPCDSVLRAVFFVLIGILNTSNCISAQPLGAGQLPISGTRLTVSPESQTVPFDTPTLLTTTLEGFDPGLAAVPLGLRVRADLRGPEIDGILVLESLPGEPLRIPSLRLEGEYLVENIRLVDGGTLLAYATPRSAVVRVTQVLVTRVTSRPLTLDEIRSYGIVVGDDSFQMFRFVFGFGIHGDEVVFEFPASPSAGVVVPAHGRFGGWRPPPSARFNPPQLVPFRLDLPPAPDATLEIPSGGCPPSNLNECFVRFAPAPLVGVIAIPTDVALLHQFFSVMLMVQNGAPVGDPLVLRDLAARITVPPGLRQAQTEPPTPLGVPVPIRMPGPDGALGTADDLSFLVAQAEGDAELLLEGLREGTHVVTIDIDGVLDGLPTGPRAISGQALGAVVVRDPQLQVTINHPEIVRRDEQYPLHLTVSNIGTAPVNLLSLSLPQAGLSGVSVVGSSSRTIPALAPGDAETVTFDLQSMRTGKVVAATVRSGSSISPQFEFSVGVSTDGIPLSPDAIVLPRLVSDMVPAAITQPALSLLGLAHSLATARASDLAPGLPRVVGAAVLHRAYRLAQAARQIEIGEDPFDALAVLAAEWQSVREGDAEWDVLRRLGDKGLLLADGFAQVFAAEATITSAEAMADRLYATTAFLPPQLAVVATGDNRELELTSQSSQRSMSGLGPGAVRDLPFGALYDLGTAGELAWVSRPEAGGYRVRVTATAAGLGDLHLLLAGSVAGTLRTVRWRGLSLAAGDLAEVVVDETASTFTLQVDRFGDGVVDETLASTVGTLAPRPFVAVAARQNIDADPTGHVVDVLLSRDVDRAALATVDADRFRLPGLVSDGGALSAGELSGPTGTPSENLRLVRVVFDNPIGPTATDLQVAGVASADGALLVSQSVPFQVTTTVPGGVVEGTVIGGSGAPVPFAVVELFEWDKAPLRGDECVEHKTGAVRADATGRFHFGFVRASSCDLSDRFRLAAFDPSDLAHGDALGRVRMVTEVTELDVVMVGRGRVEGRVLYDDGSVPTGLEVRVNNPVFDDGRLAHVSADGRFDAADVMVGAVEISANDDQGRFAFATVELPSAGALALRDLVLVRAAAPPVGGVTGTVTTADGLSTIASAVLALYVDATFVGSTNSGIDGRFDFGIVPAGVAEVEVFDPQTAASGGRVFFTVTADQTSDVSVPLREKRGTAEGRVLRQLLSGTVEPVAGAIVWADDQQANTISAADGSYRLEGVLAGTQVVIKAADPRTLERTSASVSLLAGGMATRDLVFVEQVAGESAILGQVLGFDGLPVAGALVHIGRGHPDPVRWNHEAVTGTDGRFVLRDIGVGTHAVHAIAGAVGGIALATVRFPGDTPSMTIRFKRGNVRLRTFVRNTDGTLVGIRSQVQWRPTTTRLGLVGLAQTPLTVETDALGELLISGMLVGNYQAFVSNAFHGERLIRGTLLDDGQENVHDIVFEETTGAVRGTVRDFDGETPVAGVRVAMRAGALGSFDVVTDAEGRYAFELVPISAFIITAARDGAIFRTAQITGALARGGQEIEGADIVLPAQGSVLGLVEDAAGVRVSGAVVTLQEQAFPRRALTANADVDGNFSFDNVFVGGFALRAQAPTLGGLGGRTSGVLASEGEVVQAVIALEPTGEVAGQVTSPVDGQPVAGARISLLRGGALFDTIDSDSDGRYRFRLLPVAPSYRVRAFDPQSGRFGESSPAGIAARDDLVAIDVVLQARGEVDGWVLDGPAGASLAGATVRLVSTTPFFTLDTLSSTDVAGHFLFGGVPEGSFRLSVREPQGRRSATAEGAIAMEDQLVTLDLVLAQLGAVRGSVLAPPGTAGGLFPNANVRMKSLRDGVLLGATLDNPFFLDGLLAMEPFELRAQELGGPHQAVVRSVLPAEGAELALDLQMVALGSVTVRVADSFGNPVSGAEVSLTSRSALGMDVRTGGTGADDRVGFDQVPAGSIAVIARDPLRDLRGTASALLSREGEALALSVALESTGFVRGRVLAADGVTPAVDTVAALRQGSDFQFAQIAADGSFAFAGVKLADWDLTLQQRFGVGSFEVLGRIDGNGEIDDLGDLVLDEADPQVVAITPASGTRDVAVSTPITITFSEPIDVARWQASDVTVLALGAGRIHPIISSFAPDGRSVTVTPLSPYDSGTLYEVVVNQSIVDLAGRRLAERVRATFTTADVIAPAVIDLLPRDAQNQVTIDSPVLLTFSEPVELASLSGPALELYDLSASAGVTTTFQLRPSGRQVVLTAAFGLLADHHYRLRVQGVRDLAGNTMTALVESTFWTVDQTLPVASFLSPAAGASFTAGELIPAAVSASDNRGVAEVRFLLGNGSFAVTAEPYSLDIPAPRVSVASDVALSVEVTDRFGNQVTLARTVHLVPRVNASPPVVEAPCLYDRDRVRPSRPLSVPINLSDDQGIESYVFLVDGVEQARVAYQSATTISDTFTWTPPASALPGALFVLRIEAYDYAGNVGVYQATVTTPADLILLGDQTLDALAVAGRDVTLDEGMFTVLEPLAPSSLVLLPGATLVPAPGGAVAVTASGEIRVECGAAIDVSGQGYAGGAGAMSDGSAPAGIIGSAPDAGGSHGGLGTVNDGPGPAGESFDSVYAPALGGGGGALAWAGEIGQAGAGGGAVHLTAPEMVLGGGITARGVGRAGEGGSGAGGSIWLEAGTLAGRGVLDASGEDYHWCPAGPFRLEGAGAGGRIALDADALLGFDPVTQTRVEGGQENDCFDTLFGIAGAGTVYLRTAGDVYGSLRVDAGAARGNSAEPDGLTPAATPLPVLGTGLVSATVAEGADLWVTPSQVLPQRWLGAWMRLLDAAGAPLGSFRVLAIDAAGRARLAGAGTVLGAVSFEGEYRFDRVVTAHRAQVIFDSPWRDSAMVISDTVRASGRIEADSLRVVSGSVLRAALARSLKLEVTGTLTVEAGASIDGDGAGYPGTPSPTGSSAGGAPAGIAGTTGRAGASHGGMGTQPASGSATPNATFGSLYWPRTGGAGANAPEGDGGGVLEIVAGDVTLEGTIQSRGTGFNDLTVGRSGAAGAGGSLLLSAGVLRGSGTIDVSGGSWHRFGNGGDKTGAGGGGRAALYVGTFDLFDPFTQVIADGGVRDDTTTTYGHAAPGTVLIFDSSSIFGSLRVVQQATDALPLPPTPLPVIGSGSVGTVTADTTPAGGMWITAGGGAPFALGLEGAWLHIAGVDHRILAQSADRLSLRIDDAGGAVAAGDAYEGVWKFDQVTLGGGATLVFADRPEMTVVDATGGTLVQPTGTWVSPLAGAVFTAGDPVHAEVDTGASPIARVVFHLDGGSVTVLSPPFAADLLAPVSALPAGFELRAEVVDSFGNSSSITRTIQVTPRANASAPTIDAPCLYAGDRVLAGTSANLAFSASDDEAIESYALLVDGVEVERVRFGSSASVAHTFTWTPPASAAPGQSFLVRLEARDYAGNVSAVEALQQLASGLLLSGGGTLDALGVAGLDVVLGAGSFQALEPLAPASLVLLPGATLMAAPDGALAVTASGEIRVECGAAIDVSGQGYAGAVAGAANGQAPAWVTPASPDAGGSHGGLGVVQNAIGPPGAVYDSVYAPQLAGGGGALATASTLNASGGAGGGKLHLRAASVVLGGALRARGAAVASAAIQAAAGAGGSIWLEAGTLTGHGTLDASGADDLMSFFSGTTPDGAGGGGRIALVVGVLDGFDPIAQAQAFGGQELHSNGALFGIAGAGTVYFETSSSVYGTLIADAGLVRGNASANGIPVLTGLDPATTPLPRLGSGTVLASVPAVADLLITADRTLEPRWLGAWMHLLDATGASLGSFRVTELLATGEARLEGAAAVAGAATFEGEYRFDRIVTRNRAQVLFNDPLAGDSLVIADDARIAGTIEVDALRIAAGTTLATAPHQSLHLRVAGALRVESGATIDASGDGYANAVSSLAEAGAPAGVLGSIGVAGGSHGGSAIRRYLTERIGGVYDSVFAPRFAGGGGGEANGTAGGGVIDIVAGSVQLDGSLLARGRRGFASTRGGSGAGGSVRIDTATLSGAGIIDASGGEWPVSLVGAAGGGGRVAIYADSLVGFDPDTQVFAEGGAYWYTAAVVFYAAPGTVFVQDAAATYGRLAVRQRQIGTFALDPTTLPAVGSGTIATVTPDAANAADVWIDAASGRNFDHGVEGVWVRVAGNDYRVLAQSDDLKRLLLVAAGGMVQPGDAFSGMYKLDQVSVENASIAFGDNADIASFDLINSTVISPTDIQPPVIANVSPADGTVLVSGAPVAVAATVTDNEAVVSVTFRLGGMTFVDTVAPYEWNMAAPSVQVATASTLSVDAVDAQQNHALLTRALEIQPTPPLLAPVLEGAGCVRDGTLVLASSVLPITFTLTAPVNDTISSWLVAVDGVAVASAFGLSGGQESGAGSWTVPASAVAGDSFALHIAAATAAGGVLSENRTLRIPAAGDLTGPLTLDSTRDGQDLVLGPGTFTAATPLSLASLTLMDGAVLTTTPGVTLDLSVTGTARIACGATIDVSGLGYPGGARGNNVGGGPSWVFLPFVGAGGGHGGSGLWGAGTHNEGGDAYDSVYSPSMSGGGGGSSGGAAGGDGGGVLLLHAGDVLLDGKVNARGIDAGTFYEGAGAAGTVLIQAAAMRGTGSIDVRGGDYTPSSTTWGGGGGGGRVSLLVDDLTGFDPVTQIPMRGGQRHFGSSFEEAVPGTVYQLAATDTFGRLLVAAEVGSAPLPANTLPPLGVGTVVLAQAAGPDLWLTGSTPFYPRWAGAWIILQDALGVELGRFSVLEVDAAGRARVAGAGADATLVASYAGLYRFDAIQTLNGAMVTSADAMEVTTP